MNHSTLEFFKIVKEMINSGSTCSEILKKINEQPYEIKSLFEKRHLRTLELGGEKVLKDQFNKGEMVGEIRGKTPPIGESLKSGSPFKRNDYDRFDIFINNTLKNLERKNQEKKSKSV